MDRHRTTSFTMATHLGASKSDMERDSGFSDASSEYLSAVELTDTEDSGRNGSALSHDPAAQQMTLMGGSYAGMSPMIIMNNFLLKQPSNNAPADKQWGISSPMDVMPQSQVVLLQPMVSNGNNHASMSGCEIGRQSRNYQPVKSYPRIAPYPVEHVSKRAGSSRLRGSPGCEQRQRKHHSHRVYNTPTPQNTQQAQIQQKCNFGAVNNQRQINTEQVCDKTAPPPPATTTVSSAPSFTQEHETAISNTLSSLDNDSTGTDSSNKQKRFSNTYNILSKSGLLGITMRTKQLIKENRRTQGQLQQLQEQTTLLLEALSSGDSQLWTKLQLSLQDTETEPSPGNTPTLVLWAHTQQHQVFNALLLKNVSYLKVMRIGRAVCLYSVKFISQMPLISVTEMLSVYILGKTVQRWSIVGFDYTTTVQHNNLKDWKTKILYFKKVETKRLFQTSACLMANVIARQLYASLWGISNSINACLTAQEQDTRTSTFKFIDACSVFVFRSRILFMYHKIR